MQTAKSEIKVAIIDLYDDYPNQAISNITQLCEQYQQKHQFNLSCEVFDLRGKNEAPGAGFDVYISSGGPGSPIDTEGTEWENKYWALIDAIDAHNQSGSPNKKHVLFICHSFQLMCRRYELGVVNMRHAESYGIMPVYPTPQGLSEVLFDGLADPFFAIDSREWQVIHPNQQNFDQIGATLLATEPEHLDVDRPRAMMAIRFNEYFFGTQFHPEVDPVAMKAHMLTEEHKQKMIAEYGAEKYNDILQGLDEPHKIARTHGTIIPQFLHKALQHLQ